MNFPRHFGTLALGLLLALPAMAQTANKPLNLKLPPAASATPTQTQTTHNPLPAGVSTAPGVYYGDVGGGPAVAQVEEDAPSCDDSTYNQPQVHGSVGVGVFSASHAGSGTWTDGAVNLSKRFGSCDHPSGGISITVGGAQGSFHGRHRHGF
jgi:hypothetical protein